VVVITSPRHEELRGPHARRLAYLAKYEPIEAQAGCRLGDQGDAQSRRPAAGRRGNARLSVRVPGRPGLGVEIDLKKVEEAHDLYKAVRLPARDDVLATRYVIPGWTVDPKRPCMVR
ncbi:MAG: gudD, partial [Gammaproteobacteria bacterium]|nr:gudD [Gammaproteobacteria bacterium]